MHYTTAGTGVVADVDRILQRCSTQRRDGVGSHEVRIHEVE